MEREGEEERERVRERKGEKPRERKRHRETRVFESETRGSQTRESHRGISKRRNHRRGSRVAWEPQTRGSRPAFKSGHEENTDTVIISVSCRHERDTDAGMDLSLIHI